MWYHINILDLHHVTAASAYSVQHGCVFFFSPRRSSTSLTSWCQKMWPLGIQLIGNRSRLIHLVPSRICWLGFGSVLFGPIWETFYVCCVYSRALVGMIYSHWSQETSSVLGRAWSRKCRHGWLPGHNCQCKQMIPITIWLFNSLPWKITIFNR